MPADKSRMRISWWLGRVKRALPVLVVIIIAYWIWKSLLASPSSSSHVHASGVNEGPAFFFNPPTTPPPPSKWLVVSPKETDPCNKLAATFVGWTVLLVNREKPQHTSHSGCRYLSPDETQSMQHQYEVSSEVLLGILYALQNYAEVFYVPPPDMNHLSIEYPAALPKVYHTQWLTATVPAKSSTFSNARHFGCNASLVQQDEQAEGNDVKYKILQAPAPVIFAVARIRLINQPWSYESNGDRVELKACDDSAPSVALVPGTYGDARLNGAKIHYPATWAYSVCVGGGVLQTSLDCLMWNYVVQNLLWKTGNSLMLFYDRNGLGLASDSVHVPSSKSLGLQRFLKKWVCPLESMMACGINLIDQLAQSGYLSTDFAEKQIAWFKALNAVDYQYPALKKQDVESLISSDVIFHPVNFSDNLPWRQGRKYPFSPVANHKTTERFHAGLCESYSDNVPSNIQVNFSRPWMQYEDYLLIVVFNSPYYNNIRYIETMYRTMFPRILYCGPLPLDLKEFPWARDYELSFVMYDGDTNHTAGAFHYDCMIKAVAMNYHVSGYLVIADDMFLLPHALQEYSRFLVWYMVDDMHIGEITKLRECRLGMCDFHPHWHWWEDYQQATIKAMTNLKKIHSSDTFYKCYQQLVTLNGAELRPNGANSDIYYVPARLEQQVSELFEHFLHHRVFVEIAVPTVLNCLAGTQEAQNLPGLTNWQETRDMPWLFFDNKNLLGKRFLHPTKWSSIERIEEMKELYCANIIPFLFDPYERIEINRRH